MHCLAEPATIRTARQRGTTILDGVIALAVAACGLAALAPVLASSTAMIADARVETRAVVLASSRLEQLKAAPFHQDAATLGFITDETSNFAHAPPTTDGSGLRPQGTATAWLETPGFIDWADHQGGPVPAGGGAAFVRRWSITAGAGGPGVERLVLVAFARDLAREGREVPRTSGVPRPGDVWLFTIRARGRR